MTNNGISLKKENSEDSRRAVRKEMLKEETNWLSAHLVLNLWRLNGLQVDKLKLHVLR